MKSFKIFSFTILLICFALPAFGQISIKGTITDQQSSPVAFANIILLNTIDSSIVKGEISSEDGSFELKAVSGDYLLEISMLGYNKQIVQLDGNANKVDIGVVSLSEDANLLDDILVTAKKVLFEKKADRTIVNVQANAINKGNTILNVLRSSPGISIGQDNIAMAGKQGVRIMINGRLVRMPVAGIIQMLEGMNASNVESIELITNPGAQYEAEGNAGFIDIILVKSPDLGTITNIGLGLGMNLGINANANSNIQYRSEKLSINANYSVLYNDNMQRWNVLQSNTANDFTSFTDSRTRRRAEILNQNLNAGLNYQLNSKTEFSFLLTGSQRLHRQNDDNVTQQIFSQDSSLQLNTNIREPNNWLDGSASFGIIHKPTNQSTFKVFYDKLQYFNRQSAAYDLEITSNKSGETSTTNLNTRKTTPINFNVISTDYELNLNTNTRLSTGARLAISNFENQIEFDQSGFAIYDLSGLQSATYLSENIAAAYSQLQHEANDKLSLALGLRYEHTITNIENALRENVVSRNYGNWFPTARVTYKISDRLSYQLVYNRRITRPTFNDLAPFVFFQNPSTLVQGNSQLLPAIMEALDFTINKGRYWITFQYARTNNFIAFFTPEVDEMNNTIYSTQNLDFMRMLGINLNNNLDITSWWSNSNTVLIQNYKIEDLLGVQSIDRSLNNLVVQSNHALKLKESLSANIGLTYDYNGFIGLIDYKPQWMLTAALSKRFKNGSQLSLRLNDIFASYVWDGTLEIGNVKQSFLFDQNFRAIDLTLTMPIGNKKLKKVQIENGSKAERARVN